MNNTNNNKRDFIMQDVNLNTVKTNIGEEKAWDILSNIKPEEVCKNALVSYDESRGIYTVKSFGTDFHVLPVQRRVSATSPLGLRLLGIKEFFFELSILWYLVSAKNISVSGKWIKPVDAKGGQIFFMGTHRLPLDELAEKYGHDIKGFMTKVVEYGGNKCSYADACAILYPFPRIPVKLLLWLEDDEFPPRIDLLIDSSCDVHLPTDVIWSIANTVILLML